MNIILDIITILLCIIILMRLIKLKINIMYISLIIYDIAYVIPIFFNLFLGNPNIAYTGFRLAINDSLTNIIYDIFIIVTECIFYYNIKKNQNLGKDKNDLIMNFNFKRERTSKKGTIILLFVFLSIIPIFAILIAPNIKLYLVHLGSIIGAEGIYTEKDYIYKEKFAKWSYLVGAIGVIGLKFSDTKNNIIMKLVRIFSIIAITLLNGKRTFATFIILILLFIDLISYKTNRKKLVCLLSTAIVIISYFIFYSYVTGKYEYNTDWYSVFSEYFFRGNTVKVAIYSVLNPEKLKILDYTGQSMLYNVLYFIPRTVWNSKPYSYAQYFTIAVRELPKSINTIDWYFQVSYYGEMISNFGFVGIIVAPLALIFMTKKIEEIDNIYINILGMFFIAFIQVFEYSDMFKMILLFLILLSLKLKIKFRRK